MSGLTVWHPSHELEQLEERFSKLFGRMPVRRPGEKEEALAVAEWAPLVDITEDDKEYLVKAELPEVKKEAVKVSVDHNILSISGERRLEKEEKNQRYHRMERAYGSFMRSFVLPDEVEGAKTTSEYKDGILKVHLPKSEKAKPTSIEVKVA